MAGVIHELSTFPLNVRDMCLYQSGLEMEKTIFFYVFENNYFHAKVHAYSFMKQSILSSKLSMFFCITSSNSDDIFAILSNVSYVIRHLVILSMRGYT